MRRFRIGECIPGVVQFSVTKATAVSTLLRKEKLMKRLCLTIVCILGGASLGVAQSGRFMLLQNPTVSRTQVVFSYAGNLWVASREGGSARRLTAGGHERNPAFSPDGTLVAFTGQYDGNPDVYVVPVTGGDPRRLTHHPAQDEVIGWAPDGKQVLFASDRAAFANGVVQLFTVPVEGGFPPPSRWHARRKGLFLLTDRISPTCRTSSGSVRGSAIGAGRLELFGSRTLPIPRGSHHPS